MKRLLGLSALVLVASMAPADALASVFPGSNGKIAVATEFYECGECDSTLGRVWTFGPGGATRSFPARNIAFSPSGGRIAYRDSEGFGSRFGWIWIARADGSRRHLLTRRGEEFAWSPMGGKVAYTGSRSPGGVVVSSPNGEDRLSLPYGNQRAWQLAWSPDARQVAVSLVGTLEMDSLALDGVQVLALDGTSQQTIATDEALEPSFEGLAWSGSGWLSYRYRRRLLLVRPGESQAHVSLTGLPDTEQSAFDVLTDYSWSAEGRRIAFIKDGGLWVMRAPDGTPRLVLPRPRMGFAPQWSPDGRLIAFVRWKGGSHRLFTVSARGGEPKLAGRFNDRRSGQEYLIDIDWQARPLR